MFKSFCRVLSAAVVMCFISCEPETKVEYVPVIQPESSGLFLMSVVFNTEELTAENVEVTISITREDIVKAGYVYTPQRTDWLNAREILNSESFVELIKNKNGKYVFSAAENGYYSIAAKDKDGYDIYRQEFVSNIDKIAPKEVYGLNAVYDSALQLINVSWKNLEPNDVDHCLVTCTKAGEVIETDVIIKGETYTLNNVRYDERYDYEFIVRAVDKAGNLTDGETSGVASLSHDSYTEIEGRMFEIVTFGSFPQTIKAADVTVDESVTKTAGMYTPLMWWERVYHIFTPEAEHLRAGAWRET